MFWNTCNHFFLSSVFYFSSFILQRCVLSKEFSRRSHSGDLQQTAMCVEQALTSTRGYSLPDCLNYYPYPTRNFLLPDRVEGSEENSMIYKSEEWKCNTFVMMDIFIIPRNNNFTLQLCQSPFIQVYHIIKFIKKIPV